MTTADSWRIPSVDLALARTLARELDVQPLIGEILVRRGFADVEAARAFLSPDHLVHNPFLMAGMREACARLDLAVRKGERIAVHGDYDADGVTATFVLVSVLRDLGADVVWRLPNRLTDGYGVSLEAVAALAAEGARLLVTVDCGISAHDEVEAARRLDLDVIVSDHHELVGEALDCIVVHPRLGDYPFPDLAGVGVAFKLAHALLSQAGDARVELPLRLRPYTDVVAVGTVADVVPLLGENRTLVAMGLGRLRSAPRPGLAALIEISGGGGDAIDAGTVGFRLAPRLNAAGRLGDASLALELLFAGDRAAALPLAQRLDELNADRQDLEQRALRQALAMVPDPLPAALVLSSPDWHEGVVGIVAARVVDAVHRPAILLSEDGGVAKGSGRSISAFDLLAAVEACSAPLLGFGGHRAACGVRLSSDEVPRFRELFTAHAAALLGDDDLRRTVTVDAVAAGDDLTLAMADELERFAPFGPGNPRIALLLHGAGVRRPRLTRTRKHLQCDVRLDGVQRAAIRFGFDRAGDFDERHVYDLPAVLSRNEFNGMQSAQLQLTGGREAAALSDDLCPTPCDGACRERLCGAALWPVLETLAIPDGDPGALDEVRRERRLIDRRGRPAVSTLAGLLGAGGRTLVLVADVGRRRPLLSRELCLPEVVVRRLYLNGACAACRRELALAPRPAAPSPRRAASAVVMASTVTAALDPALVAAADHIALLDPPFDQGLLAAVAGAMAPATALYALWDVDAVHFSERVAASAYDLYAECRRVYRVLRDGESLDEAALEAALVERDDGLAKLPTLAAALRTLFEAGLLTDEDGRKKTKSATTRVDLADTPTYRRWQERFTTTTYLRRCLTATL